MNARRSNPVRAAQLSLALAAASIAQAESPLGALDPSQASDPEQSLAILAVDLANGLCGAFGPVDELTIDYLEVTARCGDKPPVTLRFADTPRPRLKTGIGPDVLYFERPGAKAAELRIVDARAPLAKAAWERIAALTDADRPAPPDRDAMAAWLAVARPIATAFCSDDESQIAYGWYTLLLPEPDGIRMRCGDDAGGLRGEAHVRFADNPAPPMKKRLLDGAEVKLTNAEGRPSQLWLWKKAHDAPFAAGWRTLVEHASAAEAAAVAAFDAAVVAYRAAAVKPELPESARRFKVQAELAVRERRYADAVGRYADALRVAPWWPAGRYNRALVLAEIARHEAAIAEMRRYLALVPDAPNARQAQDLVYEWEARLRR